MSAIKKKCIVVVKAAFVIGSCTYRYGSGKYWPKLSIM